MRRCLSPPLFFLCWCWRRLCGYRLKAELAQRLIERSWQATLDGNAQSRPWPWADTRPVAVLSIPAHGIRQLVLKGNSGRNLAFGPVFLDGTSNGRDMVISGHRDTHFRFLRTCKPVTCCS